MHFSLTNDFRRCVAATDLFGALDGDALDDVASRVAYRRVRAGDRIFRQGDHATSLFMILDGRLRLTAARADGRRQSVSDLSCGHCAGAVALVSRTPHTASARAVRDSGLLELTVEEFDAVAARHPNQILRVVQRLLAAGVGVAGVPGHAPIGTIAVVPASIDVPIAAFTEALARRLSAVQRVKRLTSASATIWEHGRSTHVSSQEALAPDITSVSSNGARPPLLVLETDPVISEWTESCLANADRILVVANADGDPACGEVERQLLSNRERLPAHRDLILLQPRELPCFAGTKRWLDHRYIDAHHHVVLGCDDDLDRIGRIITGRAIGLVLSGGGARAFAHIGVIRALREAAIPIDVVAGVSMGAMIGAQLALGWNPATMAQKNREAWIDRKPLIDYTVPILGLISGGRFKQMLSWMFGDAQIEDLRIPYFCMSANLTLAEPVVHWDGPLRRWLRASGSLPGIAPPLPHRGELLADGGLITNLPVDVMRLFVDGRIIASDVASRIPLEVDVRLDDHPSPWKVLGSRLNPFGRALSDPTVLEVMWHTALLSSARAVADNRRDIDFYVHPNVDAFRLFQWDAIERIVEEGYRAAAAEIQEWKPLVPEYARPNP